MDLNSKTAGPNPAVSTNNETGMCLMSPNYSSLFCVKLLCAVILGLSC